MLLAHTKNTDPIVVMLDTGNPDHCVDSVDHLEEVNLFDTPKFPAQIRIEKDLAAAAFFNHLPKLTVYTWNLAAEPTKSSSSDKIWRRPPTRTVALDLSNFDIFDDDVPILGDVHISGKFISVFLGCIGIVVVIDLRRDRDINVKVHRTSQSILSFRGFFVENEMNFFVFEEADDWEDEFKPAFLTFYCNSSKDDALVEYLKLDELLSSSQGIKRLNEKVYLVSEKKRNFFHIITLDKQNPVDRYLSLRHKNEFSTNNCIFKLEEVYGIIVAVCCCKDHVCTYDLSTAQNPFSSVRLLPEADSSKLNHSKLKSEGIDFVVHPTNKRDKFFKNIGNWYRIWFEREKCRFQPNVGIRIPNEIDDQNAMFYPTMIHSRSKCSLLYEYMPAPIRPSK